MTNVVWVLFGSSAIELNTEVLGVYDSREAAYETLALCEKSYENDMNMYEDFWIDMWDVQSSVSNDCIPGDMS